MPTPKIKITAPKGAIFRTIRHFFGSLKGGISHEEAQVLLEDLAVIGEDIATQLAGQAIDRL